MKTCDKPCKECPYRKDSLPGYLGEASYDPQRFLTQLDLPGVHPCHMKVDWEKDDDTSGKPVCRGALEFMNNSFKLHHDPETAMLQKTCGKNGEIIEFPHNFVKHHTPKKDE